MLTTTSQTAPTSAGRRRARRGLPALLGALVLAEDARIRVRGR